jgi:hypothetical protein
VRLAPRTHGRATEILKSKGCFRSWVSSDADISPVGCVMPVGYSFTNVTEAQNDCEVCVVLDGAEIPSEVMLWRLAVERSTVTEAMIDEMLEMARSANN